MKMNNRKQADSLLVAMRDFMKTHKVLYEIDIHTLYDKDIETLLKDMFQIVCYPKPETTDKRLRCPECKSLDVVTRDRSKVILFCDECGYEKPEKPA